MAGGVRYDLKDHPCGKVTQEHLANAGKRLDEIKKKQQERRKSNRLFPMLMSIFAVKGHLR